MTIFQTRPYLLAYRRTFGAGKTFHRLRDGSASAFLQTRGRSARRLEWWSAGIHDIGDAVFATPQLWRRINDLAHEHDGAHLAQLPACSPLIELAQTSGWQVQDAEACPVLALPPDWDEYVRSLGKNMREQIKRYPKRLEKEFRVEYARARTPEEVATALDDLFLLHGKRWRARGQTGVLATPRRKTFQRRLCQQLLPLDGLRLWTLRCDDRPACVLLCYALGDVRSFFIGGFEPELMRWSVGTCLFSRVLREAVEEGAREFDFLRGEEEYKYRFGAHNRPYKTLSWFAPSPRGKLLQRRVQVEERLMQRLHDKFGAAKKD